MRRDRGFRLPLTPLWCGRRRRGRGRGRGARLPCLQRLGHLRAASRVVVRDLGVEVRHRRQHRPGQVEEGGLQPGAGQHEAAQRGEDRGVALLPGLAGGGPAPGRRRSVPPGPTSRAACPAGTLPGRPPVEAAGVRRRPAGPRRSGRRGVRRGRTRPPAPTSSTRPPGVPVRRPRATAGQRRAGRRAPRGRRTPTAGPRLRTAAAGDRGRPRTGSRSPNAGSPCVRPAAYWGLPGSRRAARSRGHGRRRVRRASDAAR